MGQTLSRESVLDILRMHKGEILKEFPVRRLALFGSLARQEETHESDIDILVDVDPSIGLKFMTLADRLQEILHCKVDLVSRRGIKPSLLKVIEKESIDV
ncbi:MAG: nucleotidyltransferase family protein [Deltaproteobacteria bacterium]|nr:nucleotidyltransferase family protein [Deltaproteobacteria bacterium]